MTTLKLLPSCMMPDGGPPCKGYEELLAERDALKDQRDALQVTLNDLLTDCINFDDGNLTISIMKRASDLLEKLEGEG